jgi:2-oxoglutarate dehydrogenase E1 component
VVLGKVRAKQDQHAATRQTDRSVVMPLLLHGDAAFAGQGVVAECFGLSGSRAPHRRHGAHRGEQPDRLHHRADAFALLALPHRRRLMVEAPIFHVNGDDPEAVVFTRPHGDRVPAEVRQGRGARHVLLPPLRPQRGRRAHAFTQPQMYKPSSGHKTTLQLYTERLVAEG